MMPGGDFSLGCCPINSRYRCRFIGLRGETGALHGPVGYRSPIIGTRSAPAAHLLVENLGDDVERWKALIEQFDNLPGPVQTRFLERLNGLVESGLDEGTKRAVSDSIRVKVSLHRRFASEKWALPSEVLGELEKVRGRFEPQNPVLKNAWLFGRHRQVLEPRKHLGKPADELRRSALGEILNQGGWEGVQRLIQEVEDPEAIGIAFAAIDSGGIDARILPAFLAQDDKRAVLFASGYIQEHFHKEEWDWVNRIKLDEWSAEEIAQFLAFLPFERNTWEFAAEKGDEVAKWYWDNPPLSRGKEGDDAGYAVAMLLRHNKPFEAFEVLQMAIHNEVALESSLFMGAIETWLATGAGGVGGTEGIEFDVLSLFQELQGRLGRKDPGVDRNRLAKLEWECLALLNGHPTSPVTLHGRLRDEAEFFVEVLGLVFRPKSQPAKDTKDISEEERQREPRMRTDCSRPGGIYPASEMIELSMRLRCSVGCRRLAPWQRIGVCSKSVIRGSERYSLTLRVKPTAPGPASP